MQGLKIASITLVILGILLYIVGYMFRIMHWPDMFKGMVTGPVVIIIAAVLFVISRNSK